MKKVILICVIAALSGCATEEQIAAREHKKEEEAAAKRIKENAERQAYRERIDAIVENQCAYAKENPISWGDCNRQTRQHLAQQLQAEWNAMQIQSQQKAQRDAQLNQQIMNSLQQIAKPPVYQAPAYQPPVVCDSRALNGGIRTTCQ